MPAPPPYLLSPLIFIVQILSAVLTGPVFVQFDDFLCTKLFRGWTGERRFSLFCGFFLCILLIIWPFFCLVCQFFLYKTLSAAILC